MNMEMEIWKDNHEAAVSDTVASLPNQQLITVIRFVSESYIRPWKSFTNRLHLVLHAEVCLFVKSWRDVFPNAA